METGVYIRAYLEGKLQSVDIGDAELPDIDVCNWLQTGGKNTLAEDLVMELLGRGRCKRR